MDKERETVETPVVDDPRYQPPYPQKFHSFWPRHAIQAGLFVAIVYGIIIFLANRYPLPMDPNMPPLPDDGMYIPGPEWYYLLFLQPFWYLKGDTKNLQFLGTFVVPLVLLIIFVLVPFLLGRLSITGIAWRIIAFAPFLLIGAAIVFSGFQGKTLGCPSCHNPYMGERQAYPPMNFADFYSTDRQRQIEVGKYRASKVEAGGGNIRGQVETYKDANWQMRHYYEPTFTW